MSNEQKIGEDGAPLHLGRFAPDADETKTSTMPAVDPGLTMLVKRAASEMVKQGGAPILPSESGELPGKAFLGAVSYCYAKGVYTSEEIEDKMRQDTKLCRAVHGEIPSVQAIRRFRRLNRAAIEQTLTRAFGYFRKKSDRIAVPSAPVPARPASATTLGETTISVARHEAEDRVQEASFIDNMSKD